MSKRKKAFDREVERPGAGQALSEEVGADLDHGLLGNQALAARLGEGPAPAPVAFDVIRDTALPMIERLGLATEIRPMSADRSARYVQILQASQLDEAQRAVLVDKLVSDQAVAVGIQGLLERNFQGDIESVRLALGGAVDAVIEALQESEPRNTGEGTVGDRAATLVGALSEEVAPELSAHAPSVSRSVASLCRALFLASYWDEEEEEALGALAPEIDL